VGLDFQVSVDGYHEFRRSVRQLQDKELTKGLKEAHKQTAAVVVRPARSEAPVRSGRLSASVKPSSTVKGAVVRAGSGKTALYAGPIHFGWPKRGIKPNRFLFRAAHEKTDEYTEIFRKLITDLVRKFLSTNE
jgi:hypothetical protein